MMNVFLLTALVGSASCSQRKGPPSPSAPPSPSEKASYARWMVHQLDWGTLATLSTRAATQGVAFGNPTSFVDGPVGNSTGTPYFFVSALDQSMRDWASSPSLPLSLSLSDAAMKHPMGACNVAVLGDPESPLCARLSLTGSFKNISGTAEGAFAHAALLARHPQMATWPKDHNWFVGALQIKDIWLMDIFGGASVVSPAAYFAAQPRDRRQYLTKKFLKKQRLRDYIRVIARTKGSYLN